MSTYVMSDIHGCYSELMKMLEKIKFDPKKDELIIAGDIIDLRIYRCFDTWSRSLSRLSS